MLLWAIRAAVIVLTTLVATDQLRDGVTLAAAFALLTLIVAEAIVTLPFRNTTAVQQFVLILSSLLACVVLAIELRVWALLIIAIPIIVSDFADEFV